MSSDEAQQGSQQPADAPRSIRELLLDVRDSVQEIKLDMGSIKRTLFGHEDKLGLVSRVATLEANQRTATWLLGIIVVLVLGFMFSIFTGQLAVVHP